MPTDPVIDLNITSKDNKSYVSIGYWVKTTGSNQTGLNKVENKDTSSSYECQTPLYVPNVLSRPINDVK